MMYNNQDKITFFNITLINETKSNYTEPVDITSPNEPNDLQIIDVPSPSLDKYNKELSDDNVTVNITSTNELLYLQVIDVPLPSLDKNDNEL